MAKDNSSPQHGLGRLALAAATGQLVIEIRAASDVHPGPGPAASLRAGGLVLRPSATFWPPSRSATFRDRLYVFESRLLSLVRNFSCSLPGPCIDCAKIRYGGPSEVLAVRRTVNRY
jgi:hypothetical protein